MEKPRNISAPVMLKGLNYLLWSRTMKTTLCSHDLWSHIEENTDENQDQTTVGGRKWFQEDQLVLSIIQGSLEASLLESYSYCETAKELWETLQNVFGNTSNLSRIYQVKKAINELNQEEAFTKHFGKFRSLWAELEMLRPHTMDQIVILERREQDKVFGLLLTLSPIFGDLVKHLLRADKLPSLDEVCAQIQKEEGSLGLFGGKEKGELVTANKSAFNKNTFNRNTLRFDDKKALCDHCKRRGHTKEQCWILHPHLKPSKWNVQPRAQFSLEAGSYNGGPYNPSPMTLYHDGSSSKTTPTQSKEVRSMTTSSQEEFVKKSDLEALIKALKENSGNMIGKSLQASYHASNISKPLIVDSGASHHMISDLHLINDIEPAVGNVMIANGAQIPIKGIGKLRLFEKESKAFYMPSFTSNLLSVKKATNDLNCNVIFSPNEVSFQDIETQRVLGKGGTKDDLYLLEDLFLKPPLYCLSSFNKSEIKGDLWHARLGHPHNKVLELLFPRIKFNNNECEACILGKHCKSVFPKSVTIYDHCFDLVHSDVWTAPYESREHHKYFVTFIDEKSKFTWITLLPSKDRVLEAFINFQTYITNQYNAKIKCFRSDNGGEYTSNAFKQHLLKHGITHQTSCPYTPQQNGVAERKNRHLMEVARSIMFHAHVPKRFWGDAVVTACYLINRTPTKILQDHSPFEVINKTQPNIDHLRVFGCVCFVLIPGDQRNKLEPKSTKAMFIGYSPSQKGYKCYDPETRRVLVSRDVKFMESKTFYDNQNWDTIKDLSSSPTDRSEYLRRLLENIGINSGPTEASNANDIPEQVQVTNSSPTEWFGPLDHEGGDSEAECSGNHGQEVQESEERMAAQEVEEPIPISSQRDQEETVTLRRSNRLKYPSHYKDTRIYYNNKAVAHPEQIVCNMAYIPQEHHAFTSSLDQEQVPRSYEEAKEHEVWRLAVGDEHHAMVKNHTWDESDLPKGKKAVSSRWVFTIKYKSNGEIERHKARLVARGFTQTYGDDYRDTFAPVAKLHTIRVVLSLATNLEWELWQMDVKNAFLQGELEEEVYMTPPPGLEDSVTPGKVLRLRKAIYGLKQSPRAWYHKLNVTLRDRGFRRSEADHTLFTLQSQEGIVVILVYVDDIIISGNDKVGISSTKEYLKSMFDIKDLGELKYFLGIEVCRFKEGLFISQRKYILDLLTTAGMLEAKVAKTPLEEGYKVEAEGELEGAFEDAKLYRRLVGKLIYLTITRPDLCFAVNQVSQHMQEPKNSHWMMVHRILRYLKGTSSQGIWMGNNGNTEIIGYCDADWAGDRNDRKSTTGYCTFIGGNLVTWKTKKQKVVSCSSAEAEYRAMRKLTTECIWLKALLQDLGIETNTPITMHCDNQAAIHIASNSVFHERTKHIEVDCHKVREAVEKGVILPCYTRSSDQLADIFTKAASVKVCEFIHAKLGLTEIPYP